MKNKLLLPLLLLIISSINVSAQSPDGFNYQAVIRDNAGELVKNQSITVKAVILSGPSASSKEYEETHTVTTDDRGHFSIVVGNGSSSGNISEVQWSKSLHHLKVEVDQGSGFIAMGTVQLQSVPYALHSKTADSVKNLNLNISTKDISDVNSTGAVSGNVLKWNGTAWVPDTDKEGLLNLTAGSGIDVSGSNVSAKTNDALWNANSVQGQPLDTKAASNGQVLKWDGSKWTASDDSDSKYFAGNGLSMSNDTFKANSDDALWNANKLNGINLSKQTPTKDQVIQFDGTDWAYTTLSSGGSGSTNSLWDTLGNNIYYMGGGNVGVNIENPGSRLTVQDSLTHSNNGFYILHDNYMYAGLGTGARFAGIRSVCFGQGGGSNNGAMNVAAGSISTGGEAIGTYSQASGDGAYNIGSFATTGEDASSQTIAYYGSARANSTFNVGLFASVNKSNSNTNYGVFSVGDSATTSYAGYFVGDVNYTGTLTNVSDIKLKNNINDLTGATDIIKQLKPSTYFYNHDGEAGYMNLAEGMQFGFIAQELEEVLPELVKDQVQMKGYKEEGSIEYKAVNYMGLIPVLTQALKEQQEMIEALEKRIETLEKQSK